MFGKLLCRLGFHKWFFGIDYEKGSGTVYMIRYCFRCFIVDEIPARMRDPRGQHHGG